MSRHASPAAQLLRNSRFFSLPQALPKPIVEQPTGFDGTLRSSDSATTAYPLRQAIITPNSSRARGDWGLKRALPKKGAQKSSEPMQHLIKNDTYEGITDYGSASPHVKTLQRFQELGVGMARGGLRTTARDANPLSAMDMEYDYTDKDTTPAEDEQRQSRRWKYENGGMRAMTPGEFDTFVKTQVRGKKGEFMQQLKACAHRQQLTEMARAGRKQLESEDAEKMTDAEIAAVDARMKFSAWVDSLPVELLTEYLGTANSSLSYSALIRKALKQQWYANLAEDESSEGLRLREQMTETVTVDTRLPQPYAPSLDSNPTFWLQWLDLVESYESEFLDSMRTASWDADGSKFAGYLKDLRSNNTLDAPMNHRVREFLDMPPLRITSDALAQYARSAASSSSGNFSLTTHPTAGLSYLRTNNIMRNHPVLGPQKGGAMAPIKGRQIAPDLNGRSVIGLAGFIAEGSQSDGKDMDFDTTGGRRLDRKIHRVHVDGDGKIRLFQDKEDNKEAIAVREGALEVPEGTQIARGPYTRDGGLGEAFGRGSGLVRRMKAPNRAKPLESKTVDQLKVLADSLEKGRTNGST